MNAISYDRPEEDWDSYEDERDAALPRRPRRQLLTWWSAGLFALLLAAIGFYVGIRVEKSQLSNSSSTSAFSAATAGRTASAGRTGAAGAAGAGPLARGGGGGARGGGFRRLLGGAGGAGGATLGTVSSVSGNALLVTDTTGNTVKVTLSSATKVTKNIMVGKKAVRPGDLVAVSGAKSSNGTISATTVSDTGASPAAAASGGSGGSSAPNNASSAVKSLFGSG
jgi:hypothetical protein